MNQQQVNYLPNFNQPPHRQLRSDEMEAEGEEDEVSENDQLDRDSTGSTASILQSRHKVKTYADISYECFGRPGLIFVTLAVLLQQITICIGYFFFLGRYFPSYIVLI